MKSTLEAPPVSLVSRIKTREAWKALNKAIIKQIGKVSPTVDLELAGFLSDLNVELHKKFGTLDKE